MLKKQLKYFVLVLLFTIPAFLSLTLLPFFTFHDEVQIVNLHQYNQAINLAGFPPRWAPDMHFNYGSPFPEFNYQLPYYLGYLFHQAGLTFTVTFKALLITSLIAGAIGMYLLALQFTSPLWAFVASVLYTFTPYHAVAVYVRGTLGESFALGLFPWVFWSLYRLKSKKSTIDLILAGLMVAALILTHQLATILMLPFIILFTLRPRQLAATTLGLLISAYYWLPVAIEQKLIQPSSPFNFYDHFPFIKQLISSPWAYGASVTGPGDYVSFQIGHLNLILIPVSLFILLFLRRHIAHRRLFLLTLLSTLLVIVLMNIRTSFFWQVFPFTQLVQFPWRLLMLTTFFTSLLFVFLSSLIPAKLTLPILVISLLLSLWPNVSYFQPGEVFDRNDSYFFNRFLPGSAEYLKHTEDYVPLPITAIRPKQLPPTKLTAIRQFVPTITDDNPLNYQVTIDQPQDQNFTYHAFYFPGWQAMVDGSAVSTSAEEHGYISFFVPQGTHQLRIAYTNTPIRQLSNYISLITLILLLQLFVIDRLIKMDILKT
ncbi:MAG: hypothetical protein ACD_40C00332G0004 [uncultured bacterium]|nr:MAG: hypothetical protein ACD_40C00332G0004 [uncultured bacterium]